jgi:Cyclin, N-terminal domain/Cyclin, C-terminal domain
MFKPIQVRCFCARNACNRNCCRSTKFEHPMLNVRWSTRNRLILTDTVDCSRVFIRCIVLYFDLYEFTKASVSRLIRCTCKIFFNFTAAMGALIHSSSYLSALYHGRCGRSYGIQAVRHSGNLLRTLHYFKISSSQSFLTHRALHPVHYQQQHDIDRELNICTHDLYLDMHERQLDYVSPNDFNPNASYLPFRRYLVDWMSDLGEQCRISSTTVHVSVLYMDKIFRTASIPRSHWQLYATVCLNLASKYEEAEEDCPHIPDLLVTTKLANAGHTSLTFREGELQVLHLLGWRLRAFPALKVAGYFLQKGVCFEDDTWQGRSLIPKIPKYVKKYAEFFCNLTLQEYAFLQYLPTQLAAATIYASRVALQVEPRWRPELIRLTGFEEEDILPIFHHVWSSYEEQFPGHGARSISPRGVTEYE